MSLILPHGMKRLQQHEALPYVWRAQCSCGFTTLGASEQAARAGLLEHINAEEPFPEFPDDMIEPGSEADRRRHES